MVETVLILFSSSTCRKDHQTSKNEKTKVTKMAPQQLLHVELPIFPWIGRYVTTQAVLALYASGRTTGTLWARREGVHGLGPP